MQVNNPQKRIDKSPYIQIREPRHEPQPVNVRKEEMQLPPKIAQQMQYHKPKVHIIPQPQPMNQPPTRHNPYDYMRQRQQDYKNFNMGPPPYM